MASRELVLLSPYRLPTQNSLTLADEDMACWLHGWSALWHPVAMWQAGSPPRVESPYDHDTPRADYVYCVPQAPQSLLANDWEERARAAGAFVFHSTNDRASTLCNLKAALAGQPYSDLPDERVTPFFGIGLGFALLATLSDAMEHENLLDVKEFWENVQQSVAGSIDNDAQWMSNLSGAAAKLLSAREVLYPVAIHLLDLVLLEDQDFQDPWPLTVTFGQPINVIASGSVLERLHRENSDAVKSLADAIQCEQAEVCGGIYLEREDALLPIESQLWNLRKGLSVSRELLNTDIHVFARRRFSASPQLPAWLYQHGLTRAVMLPHADGGLPVYSAPVMSWSAPDGQQIDCFVRKPLATDSIDAFFNLGHYLFKTTREDQTATLAFIHGKKQALPWHADLLELTRLATVAGQWTTFSKYFGDASTGEYAGPLGPDDIHFDHLTERVPGEIHAGDGGPLSARSYPSSVPVSGFANQIRLRRRLDTCWTLAALHRGLAGLNDTQRIEKPLQALEDQLEQVAANTVASELLSEFATLETQIACTLADRLLARAQNQQPGYLILNPCGFARRLALELDSIGPPMPVADPVKAVQVLGNKLLVVAEVPPLGFAWMPQSGPATGPPAPARMKLADDRCVRNEFFEAEIDPVTGGLRSIRDYKTLINRVSQRLIFRPGSAMKATKVTTTSSGPAVGEIVTEGMLLGQQDQVLAKFRQRFRAWLGRPILDLRIEIYPEQPPAGDPGHAYFGAQFAWREERALVMRGVGGMGHVTNHIRPQTPDYIEIRLPRQFTTIFPGGLPFHQREGGRMLDVILITPGEPAQVFDLAIGLDREQPMQTALGLVTPATVVPTTKGPPHIGAKGWLFHLDAPNLVLTSMRPGGLELPHEGVAPREHVDAVTVRLLECANFSTPAELRCVRDPQRVALLDARGLLLMEGTQTGDAAMFHAGPGSFLQLLVQFSV
ncbi:MAG TPA: hypothetical protein VE988_14325 [Gemmataceae bacterium]|nr:hypothetical protein [Gemmataceae bacterium]